jgi:hypothetical protein
MARRWKGTHKYYIPSNWHKRRHWSMKIFLIENNNYDNGELKRKEA